MADFEKNVAGVGALADPVRRELYQFVSSQNEPVSRDQAAEAVGIARHQAKFHLDRLEAEGLLETDYVRLTGRSGPGAGRPAKRYRRASGELSVTIPAREYDLAGHIMAEAISDAANMGTPIPEALQKAASNAGTAIAEGTDRPTSAAAAMDRTISLLSEHGYEPRRVGETVLLTNCPFHSLARSHTQVVCHMNQALISGLADSIAPGLIDVRLEPGENRCCVTLRARDDAEPG